MNTAAVKHSNRIRHDRIFPTINTIFLILLMFITLYPVINTVAYSFNDGTDALRGNIGLWPRVFSLESYRSILSDKAVYQAAWISASKTVIITLLNLFWTSMLAYTLSRKEFVLRRFITVIMVLTMYVNAGLIPNYLLISKTLHLSNSYLVYIIPTMFSCFNMIVIRTYIAGLPEALVESAKIDGAGALQRILRVILPLITPQINFCVIYAAITSLNGSYMFVELLTKGGPGNASEVLGTYMKTVGYNYHQFGYATAVSMMILVVTAVMSVVLNKLFRADAYEY